MVPASLHSTIILEDHLPLVVIQEFNLDKNIVCHSFNIVSPCLERRNSQCRWSVCNYSLQNKLQIWCSFRESNREGPEVRPNHKVAVSRTALAPYQSKTTKLGGPQENQTPTLCVQGRCTITILAAHIFFCHIADFVRLLFCNLTTP